MPLNCRRFVLPVLLALSLGQAEPGGPRSAPATQEGVSPLRITLMDGSMVVGKLSVDALSIDTAFGALKVPVDQVVAFAPGLRSHPAFEKTVNEAIAGLSAESFADREKAQEALTKIGPDLRLELERQLKAAEAEKQMRLQKILEEFDTGEEDVGPQINQWREEDVVVTPGFTIVGRITTPGFAVNSPYGALQVKLADVREARRERATPEEVRKTVTVTGNGAVGRNFTSSNIRLNKGDQVFITATGQINMTPFGNVQCGPDGAPNLGMQQPDNVPNGSLIGRITSGSGGGEVMKMGSKHTFTASKSGTLEFSIAIPGDFGGAQFPGEFQVKVRVVRKPG